MKTLVLSFILLFQNAMCGEAEISGFFDPAKQVIWFESPSKIYIVMPGSSFELKPYKSGNEFSIFPGSGRAKWFYMVQRGPANKSDVISVSDLAECVGQRDVIKLPIICGTADQKEERKIRSIVLGEMSVQYVEMKKADYDELKDSRMIVIDFSHTLDARKNEKSRNLESDSGK